jgi:hypothetical protein
MRDIDHVIALSTEVSSLREALAKKERELASLLREAPRGSLREAKVEGSGGKARKPGRGAIMDAIREALSRSEEPLRVGEIAAAVDANPVSVATMVKRLLARGEARRVSKGRYSAA